MEISEKSMESHIEEYLVDNHGYVRRSSSNYDKSLCMDKEKVIGFILSTQPERWEQLKQQHGDNVSEMFLKRLKEEIEKRGTMDILRRGIKDYGVSFDLFYPVPESSLNEKLNILQRANIFSVIRQLYFSQKNNKSLDLVIFINGLPIITMELKDRMSGSHYSVQDAIKQYMEDRDPHEPLFKFGRCLVHFAVDDELVYMTTKLESQKTRFFPFNKGNNGGSGNPLSEGYRTEYLWSEILSRESLSDITAHFVQLQDVEDENGKPTGEKKIIFPRYHQLDAVRKLTMASRQGPGHSYLVQHSAGSGKSNTISWLGYRLASLHVQDRNVYDSVIVVTDRKVLDRQLQRTLHQFEHVSGLLERIDRSSSQLKDALEKGRKVIVTTMQKFPRIVDQIRDLPGKNFAVIIDEAHSSTTGENSKNMKLVLTPRGIEDAEEEDTEEETYEDLIVQDLEARGKQNNVSYYAFTATPKAKTLELFGQKMPDGKYEPFHTYTMKQAIEEGFILDVLKNYTNYETYFSLLKKVEDDPRYESAKAKALLKAFVDLNDHAIEKKIEIMIDHFNSAVRNKIPNREGRGQAKAMIVTRSRLHAVRFKVACDAYMRKHGYRYKTLVAFSGTVRDPKDGQECTEASMNGFTEAQTALTFRKPEYRILIAANKFQTGFDEPLLYAMYVDKKLAGVAAVQTMSRLDRPYEGKEDPIVLDFANDPDTIEKAFEPYYGHTSLSHGTDPNLLYDFQRQLEDFHIFADDDITKFAKIFYDRRNRQEKLFPVIDEVVTRFNDLEIEEQEKFRKLLRDYLRAYAFLSQIISFSDKELEKLYAFGKYLMRKLPIRRESLPLEILRQVDLDSYRIELINQGEIRLRDSEKTLAPKQSLEYHYPEEEEEPLSRIIEEMNDRYGTEFSDSDKVILLRLKNSLETNQDLKTSAKINSQENFKLSFRHMFDEVLLSFIADHFAFYKKVNDNKNLKKDLVDNIFSMVYKSLKDDSNEDTNKQ
ncbi:MAG: type I restriction endonuclease subunit R [Thermoplasmataceae archaeon]